MASIIRQAMGATLMKLRIACTGMSYVGLNLAGTWVGTVRPYFSQDGVTFASHPLAMTPFASGTDVTSMTANGNWFAPVAAYQAVQVVFTRTSGTVLVTLATSIDSSYQDAFLTAALRFPNSTVSGATNTLTQAAQANRAWRLRTLIVTVDTTPTWASSPNLIIKDGTTLMWGMDLPASAGVYQVNLPSDPGILGLSGGGLVNTPGNAMSIVAASGGGSVKTNIDAEFSAA